MNIKEETGLSHAEIAAISGVSPSAISMAENGKRKMPENVEELRKMIRIGDAQYNAELHLRDEEFVNTIKAMDKRIRHLMESGLVKREQLEKLEKSYERNCKKKNRSTTMFWATSHNQDCYETHDDEFILKNAGKRAESRNEAFFSLPEKLMHLKIAIGELRSSIRIEEDMILEIEIEKEGMVARRKAQEKRVSVERKLNELRVES